MSHVSSNQPDGTPTWIDLGIPDLDRATEFYRALFGWDFETGPAEAGYYTTCLLEGRRVAALMPNPDPDARDFWWNVYLATDDVDVRPTASPISRWPSGRRCPTLSPRRSSSALTTPR